MAQVNCRRRPECRRHPDEPAPGLARPPFRSELGQRIQNDICAACWSDWLQHQTMLINHFGLNPRRQESRDFLYQQVKAVLFGEGEAVEIDTSQQGTIPPQTGSIRPQQG